MKIAVAGTGYVGLSVATLLAQHNEVVAVDVVAEKVDSINKRISPIQDDYIERYFAEKELNLRATLDAREAYHNAAFVVIAVPTNYDSQKNFFDTSLVEAVVREVIKENPDNLLLVPGISEVKAKRIYNSIIKYQSTDQIIVELKRYGFTINEALTILNKYGENSISIVEKDIYKLLIYNFRIFPPKLS